MKNLLTIFTFVSLLSIGIFLDSLLIDYICSLFVVSLGWMISIKILLWIILSLFTGGIIFIAAFLAAGAMYTSVNK